MTAGAVAREDLSMRYGQLITAVAVGLFIGLPVVDAVVHDASAPNDTPPAAAPVVRHARTSPDPAARVPATHRHARPVAPAAHLTHAPRCSDWTRAGPGERTRYVRSVGWASVQVEFELARITRTCVTPLPVTPAQPLTIGMATVVDLNVAMMNVMGLGGPPGEIPGFRGAPCTVEKQAAAAANTAAAAFCR